MDPCLPEGYISTTCAISVLEKCEVIEMQYIYIYHSHIYRTRNSTRVNWFWHSRLWRRQAIIRISAVILAIGPLGTTFSEILIESHTFSFKKTHFENVVWKMAAILFLPLCVNASPTTGAITPEYLCLRVRVSTGYCRWLTWGSLTLISGSEVPV